MTAGITTTPSMNKDRLAATLIGGAHHAAHPKARIQPGTTTLRVNLPNMSVNRAVGRARRH